MKKIILSLTIISCCCYFIYNKNNNSISGTSKFADTKIEKAYKKRISNIQVEGQGFIAKILKDDNNGIRHQRFILKLSSGHTLLIAHNIDLAPRINYLKKGETIVFYGEYEWNNKGGVIHWTHKDPKNKHINGWLKYKGKVYQ